MDLEEFLKKFNQEKHDELVARLEVNNKEKIVNNVLNMREDYLNEDKSAGSKTKKNKRTK